MEFLEITIVILFVIIVALMLLLAVTYYELQQFKNNKEDLYSRIQVALDYISNMTDLYAVQLYKDLKGV